jgi:hypothetical protein
MYDDYSVSFSREMCRNHSCQLVDSGVGKYSRLLIAIALSRKLSTSIIGVVTDNFANSHMNILNPPSWNLLSETVEKVRILYVL